MFNSLHLKLTTSSILKMLALVALIGGALYGLTIYYLAFNTDKALREQMAIEYQRLDLPLPIDLADLERALPIIDHFEEYYDSDEVGIYTMPLDAQGRLIQTDPSAGGSQFLLGLSDRAAVQAARENGSDLRSIYSRDGVRVRLLTYRLPSNAPMAFLQIAKMAADEDFIKHRMLLALFLVGIGFTLVAGGLSWWLTGRSLRPTRHAWERQQTFVANASHELRTPLTLIRVSAQVAQQNLEPDNPQRLLLDDVLSETDYMSKLVDDLLLLSRLDADQLKLDLCTIRMSELLPRIEHAFASLARERGVWLCIKQAEGAVLADPTRLWQVLLIVLDNAFSHTLAGGVITLDSKVRDQDVHISVADTGKGIAPEDLQHVFDRFYKADRSRNDRRSAGLGLSIAKPLVELHGGDIRIDSKVNIGTRVTIALPARVVPQTIEQEAELSPSVLQS
jgi:signal transduction histidine kinase